MTRLPFAPALLLSLLALLHSPASAQLRPSRLVGDGMVMQRGAAVPIWGWAEAGAPVTVTLDGRRFGARADATGAWKVMLPPRPAGGPYRMTIESGGERVEVRDVLVGDVWIASGQSNMEWTVADSRDAARVIAAAGDRRIRHFKVPQSWAEAPEETLAGGEWQAADSATVASFSAVAYFFARELREHLDVPIGIINTTWGGANIETWMSRQTLRIGEAEWEALMQRERARESTIRDSLRARIGDLPASDAGLVDGRAVWADPALDDADWIPLPVPSYWEQGGFDGLDGTAWYRTSFSLSAEEAEQGARLSLGRIDDDDVTWINGVEVGRTVGYAEPRRYDVPAAALRAGTNVLAIHVADGAGGGGPYGDPGEFHVEVGGRRRPLAGTWKFRVGSVAIRPDGQRINKVPSLLYNKMVHPLLPYPITGVIWYQGESNANTDAQGAAYRRLFSEMIRSWRRAWTGGIRDFPFLWVQLPGFGAVDSVPPAHAAWATLRESQTAALELPNTGQVVAIDLGDPGDIHPRDKQPVGERLAQVARRVAYDEPLLASGPTYRRHQVRDGRVVIEFDHAQGGLVSPVPGQVVHEFAVAGADRRWVWAEARVQGDRVVVWSPEVPHPVAVRYAWSNSPRDPSLYNRDGLPARPFRTDSW